LEVDLSEPNARTTQDAFEEFALYINAPFAVIVELLHVVSAKSTKAVVPEVVGVTETSVLPPAL
jgi:hypothetical protein